MRLFVLSMCLYRHAKVALGSELQYFNLLDTAVGLSKAGVKLSDFLASADQKQVTLPDSLGRYGKRRL